MLFTLQARWILLLSFVGTTFLIKSSLSRMIHSIWLKTKFKVLDIPAKILAFRSWHTWYTVAAKLSLREKLTKLLPCQETVAHRIHSSQPFVILGMLHLSQTSKSLINKRLDCYCPTVTVHFWTVTVWPLLRFLTISGDIELRFKQNLWRWKDKTWGYKFYVLGRT
jgi:hypothetical protein